VYEPLRLMNSRTKTHDDPGPVGLFDAGLHASTSVRTWGPGYSREVSPYWQRSGVLRDSSLVAYGCKNSRQRLLKQAVWTRVRKPVSAQSRSVRAS